MKKLIIKITALTAFVFVLGLNINSLFIQSDAQSDLTLSSLMNVAEASFHEGEGYDGSVCLLLEDEISVAPEGQSFTLRRANCYDENNIKCQQSLTCVPNTHAPSTYWSSNFKYFSKCRKAICYYN